jgi:hypothetical protein
VTRPRAVAVGVVTRTTTRAGPRTVRRARRRTVTVPRPCPEATALVPASRIVAHACPLPDPVLTEHRIVRLPTSRHDTLIFGGAPRGPVGPAGP